MIKLTLEKLGQYVVCEENDGGCAWKAASEFKPHLIFLDIVMPTIDGGQIASQIRSDPFLKDVPIVFLTAIVSQKNVSEDALINGFPFIAKPVTLESLIRCIKNLLKC